MDRLVYFLFFTRSIVCCWSKIPTQLTGLGMAWHSAFYGYYSHEIKSTHALCTYVLSKLNKIKHTKFLHLGEV